jgi:uncharacterized phage-associated protein
MAHFFDPEKAAQAAAVLLRFDDHRMEYMRLLKLLYIADRESILETGRPIVTSLTTAMDHGPLSSDIYDLIKGEVKAEALWSRYIKTHGHDAHLINDPGRGGLSKYEIAKLNDVSKRYEHLHTLALSELTHDFEEWQKNKPPKGSSRPIPIGDIIDAVGRSDDKDEIVRDLNEKSAYDRFFEGARK